MPSAAPPRRGPGGTGEARAPVPTARHPRTRAGCATSSSRASGLRGSRNPPDTLRPRRVPRPAGGVRRKPPVASPTPEERKGGHEHERGEDEQLVGGAGEPSARTGRTARLRGHQRRSARFPRGFLLEPRSRNSCCLDGGAFEALERLGAAYSLVRAHGGPVADAPLEPLLLMGASSGIAGPPTSGAALTRAGCPSPAPAGQHLAILWQTARPGVCGDWDRCRPKRGQRNARDERP